MKWQNVVYLKQYRRGVVYNMKFRTRLMITFTTIIVLPLLLTAIAFYIIGGYLINLQQGQTLQDINYSPVAESFQTAAKTVDEIYNIIVTEAQSDVSRLESAEYLDHLEDTLPKSTAYYIIRKNGMLLYSNNPEGATRLLPELPAFGEADGYGDSGYYFTGNNKYVRLYDFYFQDGGEGTIFVVAKMNSLISKTLLVDMFIAILCILIFTSLLLSQWIHKGVFTPISELNTAMRKIKEGNFDYMLQTDVKGEMGDLYRNYEDMRLRLKESTEENKFHEKQHKELVSNISHDLKTPITAIKGYVEGIMDGVADTPEKVDKYIRTIYNKANDMDKLINELTTYSRVDNNRINYKFLRINVADYFSDCVEEIGLDLESRNISLNYTDLVESDTMVIADPEQMKKVINNIISNSVKYMDKPKGEIDIRILDEVDAIRIEIEDNGKGIAPKDLPLIFERFYRTDASRNSAQGGSGIGLSIVKKIVEDHGGYIWATSREGEGTCIHFVLRKYKELERK